MLTLTKKTGSHQSLNNLVAYNTDSSWRSVFGECTLEIDRIEAMLQKLQCEYSGCEVPITSWFFVPRRKDLFRVFNETIFHEIKVVIVGMDPYPGFYHDKVPLACGIAFSAEREVPKSLINIFAEIKRCIPDFILPPNGDLRRWCKQGVLLINASLTHLPNTNGTQKEVWLPLVYRLLGDVTTHQKNLAICLWGRDAQGYLKYINGNHLILTASHPSPLSASKGEEPFNGSQFPLKINEYLVKNGKGAVDWSLV